MNNSKVTPIAPPPPDATPSDVATPPQSEQNAKPPELQPEVPQAKYFKSKIGIIKITSIVFAAIAFALILVGFVKGKYYDFKCTDEEKSLSHNFVPLAPFRSQDYETCEDYVRGTFQNCQVHERREAELAQQLYDDHDYGYPSTLSCPHPVLVKASLILIGLVFGVIVILFVYPVASADIRKNPKFLKLDMALQYVGFGIYLISAILIMIFMGKVFYENYHSCLPPYCEDYYDGIYELGYIITGGVFTLTTAILVCVVGCLLMSKTRRQNGGVAVAPGYSMGGGMMSTGGMGGSASMGGIGYGSPMVAQGYVGYGQTGGMGYAGGGQVGGLGYMGGSPTMANNMGMNAQPMYSPSPGGSQPRP